MIRLSDNVSFLPEHYASQGNAVLGIRGSGKTYSATYLAEQLLGEGIPFVAFDPIGVWKFLKVPGAGRAFEIVVAGGEDGDIPLTPQSTGAIVRAAMTSNIPLVLDLYAPEFSKADARKIVEEALHILLYENKRHGLRHVFLEEAAEFCPQRILPDQSRVYAAVERLARMGGNALLGYTLINQRAEEVNKAVLELCDCLFLHRQKGRNSLTALGKWLSFVDAPQSKAIVQSLPTLKQGECWVWPQGEESPQLVRMPEKQSLHPDRSSRVGSSHIAFSRAIDVTTFVEQMKLALVKPEEAEKAQPAPEPKKSPKRHADPAAPARALKPSSGAGEVTPAVSLDKIMEELSELEREASAIAEALQQAMKRQRTVVERIAALRGLKSPGAAKPLPAQSVPTAPSPPPRQLAREAGGKMNLHRGLRRILVALAQRPQGLTKRQLALRSGYTLSGTFRNYLSQGKKAGWLVTGNDVVAITSQGLSDLGPVEPLPTGEELIKYWLGQLGASGAAKMFEHLVRVYPNAMTKGELAEAVQMAESGTFRNYLSKLRTLLLIEGKEQLRASTELFEG